MSAPTDRPRRSAFGIALLVVSVLALLFIVFLMSQRGGAADGELGADGIDQPTQLETEDVVP